MAFGLSAGAAIALGAGVATVGSALIGANATSDAAGQQAQSSAEAIAEQRRQYDLTRSDFAPYRDAGRQALGQYQTEINGNTSAADALAEPGYQFGLQQGQLGLDRKAAAAGGRVSGAALKSASEYATNYAATGYNAAYQRRQDRLNRLASLAGIGQSATNSSAVAGAGSTNQISGILGNQGDAAGAARMAQGNIWGNSVNQLGAVGQRWANNRNSSTITSMGGTNEYGWGNQPEGASFNIDDFS